MTAVERHSRPTRKHSEVPRNGFPIADLGVANAISWRDILDSMFGLVGVVSPDGVVLDVNRAPLDAADLQRQDVVGRPFFEAYWWSYSEPVQLEVRTAVRAASQGKVTRQELLGRFKDGKLIPIDCVFSPLPDANGRVVAIACSGVDVSARRDAEISLRQANRDLRLLIDCNQALVRISDEAELLRSICELIVATGGYRMAWVGFAEDDATKVVRPAASAGVATSYLRDVRITWDDSPTGAGPTGRAIRERTAIVCTRLDDDPNFAPWRKQALAHGYQASIAVPLILESGLGALMIYSDGTPAFPPEEVALLVELANDLAHGISTLRKRLAHERAEAKLKVWRQLLDKTNDLLLVADAQTGRLIDVNETAVHRLGYTRDELLQMKLPDFSSTAAEQPWPERLEAIRKAGSVIVEGTHRCKDAQCFPVESSVSYVEQAQQGFLISVARDVTERKRHEEQIARLTRVLRMQSSINAAVLRIREGDNLLREACRIATEVGGYDRATLWIADLDGRRARATFSSGATADLPYEALELGDGPEGDGSLTSRAIRSGEIEVCNDLSQSQPPIAMRERLLALGYKSLVAIPLNMQARQGALLLASRATNQVSRREMLLLQDIRSSLAFALQSGEDAGAAKYLAYFDPLTGLAKRTLLCERVDGVLRTLSGPESALTIAAFDIHGLTDINDRFGYRIGDLLLQQVAERLKRNIETQERIGHLGGGTFVLLEPGLSASAENVAALLEGTVFGEPFDIDGNIIRGSFSLGITRYPNDGGCADVLIQNAEAALKRAKEGTGERYLTYEVRMHGEAARRMELEHKLRAALDQQEFVIHYQPIVDVVSGRIQSLEALLRWSQPEGIVSPAHFLPLLESSGLIVPVGTWVLERAVRDCLRLQSLGLGPVRIAVNISALQLRRRSFVDEVLKVAAGLSGEGYGLDLEITESGLLQDIGATTRKLQRLRAAGIGVALDDFGTGYSSLGLLSKLPVDVLKIDRSFVKGLPRDSASVALTSSIVGLATAFGLGTVAEGVETAEQLAKIRELGCRRWQGYLYSRPVVLDEIEVMLASGVPLASTGVAARPN